MRAFGTRRLLSGGFVCLILVGLARGEAVPLAVSKDGCECVLATPQASTQFYLLIGSLAESSRITQVSVRTQAASGPAYVPVEAAEPDQAWRLRVETQARFLERQRGQRPALNRFSPQAAPQATRNFYLFLGARDLENPAHYSEIHADLHGVGRHGQVYVDRDDRDVPGLSATVASVLRLFDEEVFPWAERNLGQVVDVDRDGRFTILLTARLGKLQNGAVHVDGFVRGSDFFRELRAPFSNRCDMLYLNSALKPGPRLRTVLLHEYTHAVTFCEHALTSYAAGPTYQDEESWLNEGLSHLVENEGGQAWSNLDHRLSTFLARPERFPLVVSDYYAAGQWRNPGLRGAAFLFLRSCRDRTDDALVRRLVQSPLRGIANLEAATRTPFAALFRQAALDLLDSRNYGTLHRDGTLLCGPRFHAVALDGGKADVDVAATASALFLLHSPAAGHARVHVDSNGPVQLTLVPLPAEAARLSLEWRESAGTWRLALTSHHRDIVLRGAAWHDSADAQMSEFASWLKSKPIAGGTTLVSAALPGQIPHIAEAVLSVLGEDMQGRRVTAWIVGPQHPHAKESGGGEE